MNTFYTLIVAMVLILSLVQATKVADCGAANAVCWSTDDCCGDLKCFYADRNEGLKGFCESPAVAAKKNLVEFKATNVKNLREQQKQ